MKIAIINDTHFGVRNDHQGFLDYMFQFFDEQFFPYLIENDIKVVFHLGDVFDRRKFINMNTLHTVRTKFFERLESMGVHLHIIPGNHDCYYKNTNTVNSVKELTSHYQNVDVYEKPKTISFDGKSFLFLPWLSPENTDSFLSYVDSNDADVLLGHLELNGHYVIPGVKFRGGLDSTLFNKFELVLSGHFHQHSTQGNVNYLGTQYQLTFNDLGSSKGFWVYNTNSSQVEFIVNPKNKFFVIEYDEHIEDFDCSAYAGCYVRVIVKDKKDVLHYERFMDCLYQANPENVTIVDDQSVIEVDEEKVDFKKDTLTLLMDEIDKIETIQDKDKLKSLIRDIYVESWTK
mgnify:CR=1 FL=1